MKFIETEKEKGHEILEAKILERETRAREYCIERNAVKHSRDAERLKKFEGPIKYGVLSGWVDTDRNGNSYSAIREVEWLAVKKGEELETSEKPIKGWY